MTTQMDGDMNGNTDGNMEENMMRYGWQDRWY